MRLLGLWLAATLVLACGQARAAPLTIDTRLFDTVKSSATLPNGQTLAWVELGDSSGRPVALIHGYTDNARDWAPLTPHLSRGLRLIVIDLRGHGQSGKPACCYTRQDMAWDVKLLLDGLGIAKADIIGHSLGSIVAQTFAELWPEQTRKVVLISSTAGRAPGEPGGFDFVTPILGLKDPIDPNSPFMMAWWSSPTPVDEDFLRRQREDSAKIPAAVWRAVIFQGLMGLELRSTLPLLKAPTLMIWGGKDTIITSADREGLIAGLPAARVKLYPGLGHNPFWEEPGLVADDIEAFLAE